jgi:hypothetical protein
MSGNQSTRATEATDVATCFHNYVTGEPIDGTPPPLCCPFCGSREVGIVDRGVADDGAPFGYNVECVDCHCEGPLADTHLDAANAWNTRQAASPTTHRAGWRSIDSVVEERVTDVQRATFRAAGGVDLLWQHLQSNNEATLGGMSVAALADALDMVRRELADITDRLDSVNLCDSTSRPVVRTAKDALAA